jgi:hypothetical protein
MVLPCCENFARLLGNDGVQVYLCCAHRVGDILLDIDIDGIGLRHLTLSLQTMHILRTGDNNDDNL